MIVKAFFVNTKTQKEYEIVGVDKEKNEVVLRGPHATFRQPFDKEQIQRLGYKLVRKEVEE